MTTRRPILAVLLVISIAAALWQFRIVATASGAQGVGFFNRDLYTIYYPLYSFFFRGAELMPAWNPYQMAGTPTVGYLAGGLYYPPHLLYAVLPVHHAMGVLAAAHLALTGIGTLLLARACGASTVAALLAAVGFLSNAMLVNEHLRLQYLEGLSWIPMVAFGLRQVLVAPGTAGVVILAGALAMQLLTGDAQIVCYEVYFGGLAAVVAFVGDRSWRHRRHLGRVALAVLVAAGLTAALAAVQILPTLAVVGEAVRGYGGLTLEQTLPPPQTWAFFVSAVTSSGVIVLLVPFCVLVRSSARRDVAALAVVAAAALGVGCGTLLYRSFFYHLPGVALFRMPNHCLLIAALALCVLAGLGLDAVRSGHTGRLALAASVLAAALALLLRADLGSIWVALLAIGLALLAAARTVQRATIATAVLIFVLVGAERFAHTANTVMIPPANDATFFRKPPFVDFLRTTAGLDRVLVVKNWRDRFPLMEKIGSQYGFSVVQDFEALTPRIYHEFLSDLEQMNPDRPLFWGRFVAPPMDSGWRALDLLSTRWVVTAPNLGWAPLAGTRFREVYRDSDAVVYENLRALPRVQVVQSHRVVPDRDAAIDTVLHQRFDPRREVVLDRAPADQPGDTADVAPAAQIVSRSASGLVVFASSPRPAMLVVNDLYWPGWQASIDGQPTTIYRANGIFRAVALPAGGHRIVFSYVDARFRTGAAVSIVALLGCLAAVSWNGRGRTAVGEESFVAPDDRTSRRAG